VILISLVGVELEAMRRISETTLRRAYEVLNVQLNATDHEVRTAFRKLARKWHPDVTGAVNPLVGNRYSSEESSANGSKNRFQDIAQAYEVIMAARLRMQQYPGADVRYYSEDVVRSRGNARTRESNDWADLMRNLIIPAAFAFGVGAYGVVRSLRKLDHGNRDCPLRAGGASRLYEAPSSSIRAERIDGRTIFSTVPPAQPPAQDDS